MKLADPSDAFKQSIGEAIGGLAPTTVLRRRFGEKQWFDTRAGELMMQSRLLIVPGVEHAVQINRVDLCLLELRPRRSMVIQNGVT